MPTPFVTRARYNDLKQAHAELKAESKQEIGDLNCAVGLIREAHATAVAKQASAEAEVLHLRDIVSSLEHTIEEMRGDAQVQSGKLERAIDWIVKGTTGQPLFADLPVTTEEVVAVPTPPVNLATVEVPGELEEAIQVTGRRARGIVNHIDRKRGQEFAEGAGQVRAMFQNDREEIMRG